MMVPSYFVEFIARAIAPRLGAPSGKRWLIVTAILGWAGALLLSAWLVASIFRVPGIVPYLGALAGFLISIALYLDKIAGRR